MAPFYWWLTRAGARLVEGTSPAPGRGTPNPLFLRQTAAIAGLYVAMCDAGPNVGLTLTGWRRDEDAWEDWSSHRGVGRLRPDAYAEVYLDVDETDGAAGALVEVGIATMDQARLRAKVARHRRYCQETIWWDRHPCCPALLLVTTSEARVNRFLDGVEKGHPRPSPYERENPVHYDELVAACAAVNAPEEAVCAPVWRAAVGDAPITLSALLAPEVRQYRRVVTRVEAVRQLQEEHRCRYLINDFARDWQLLAEALGDDEAAAVIRYLFDGPLHAINAREGWGLAHLELVEATAEWWAKARTDADAPPPSLVAGCRECWLAQADLLLSDNEAVRLVDPRVCRPAAALAAGALADRALRPISPIEGQAVLDAAVDEHERRRSAAVAASPPPSARYRAPRRGRSPASGGPRGRLPHHQRGDRQAGWGRPARPGDPGSGLPHHPRDPDGDDAPGRFAKALRPYARALVALALEVRAEGLALPRGRRSDGPIGKGGGRCAA